MGQLKKSYQIIAFISLLHIVAAVGAGLYLAASGRVTLDDVKVAVDYLRRSESTEASAADEKGETALASEESTGVPRPGSHGEDVARRNLERLSLVADHRLKLANRQMVEVNRRSEEVEQRWAEQEEQQQAKAREAADKAFKKDLELLSLLKPKVAVENLLARTVEDAARMLMAMDSRQGKKIIEASSKDPAQWAKMLAIQRRIRQLPDSSSETAK